MVLGVRTPGRVGRRRSLATRSAGHRDRRSSAFRGVTCPAMSAPPPRPGRRSGPPGRAASGRRSGPPGRPVPGRRSAPAGRDGAPARRPDSRPSSDGSQPPPVRRSTRGDGPRRGARRDADGAPASGPPARTVPRGNAVTLPMWATAGPIPEPHATARGGHRDDPDDPPVARTPDPAAAAVTTPVRAAAVRRVVRAATRAGAPDANRPPRPSGERPRSAAGAAPRTPRDPAVEQARIEGRTLETWIDEGSVRAEAVAAARRATTGEPPPTRPPHANDRLDPTVEAEISETAGGRSADLLKRLASASEALDRERFDEAHRMVAPLIRQFPGVAAVHELAGLASYRVRPVEPGDHRARGGAGHHSVGRPAAGAGRLLPGAAAMGRRRGDLAGRTHGVAGARDRRRGAHRRRRVARRSG